MTGNTGAQCQQSQSATKDVTLLPSRQGDTDAEEWSSSHIALQDIRVRSSIYVDI